jgi:dihydroorotase
LANPSPVAATAGVVEQVLSLGEQAAYATVRPIGAVTVGLAGEKLAELGAMATSRAQVRVFSDDGFCVSDPLLMRRALEYVKAFDGVIAQHAQEPRLTADAQMNEGALSGELGLAGWPAVAEEAIIARDVLLAEHVGARLHICHLSTAGSVDVVRWAKARGIAVTAEVTPHHLLLDETRVAGYDARFKVNPPLRRAEDVAALRAGLADGTIDIIATDHAPHALEEKEQPFEAAPFGVTGLETAFPVLHTELIAPGVLRLETVVERMTTGPCAAFGLERPRLAVGAVADLALWDLAAEWTVRPERFLSRSANSAFLGRRLAGLCLLTLAGGQVAFREAAVEAVP